MWPAKNSNIIEKYDRKLEFEVSKIYEKFGTTILSSNWVSEVFNEKTIALGGIKFLIEISKCENCINYLGVNPILRKLKKIHVISGFCNFYNEGIKKPEISVCSFFEPTGIQKNIILINLKEKMGINNPFSEINEEY